MRFGRERWQELWYTVKSNKRRTIVTSLGVFAGMAFFTVLIGLSNGLQNSVMASLKGITKESIYFIPGRTTKPYQGYKANRQMESTYRDFLNIKTQSRTLADISGFTSFGTPEMWGTTQVSAHNKSFQENVWAVAPNYFEVAEKITIKHGRILSRQELESGALVCMVHEDTAKRFYDNPDDMVGTYITAGGLAFRVIGTYTPYAESFGGGNKGFLAPLALAVTNNMDKPIFMVGLPKQGYTEREVKLDVFQVMARRQRIDPTDDGALVTMSVSIFTNIFDMIASGINILVWVVGMGTLTTGVISVSNILLVTVRERQREIGVRRAIGAKPRDIRSQFMGESILIIFLAGSLGMIIGMIGTLGIGAVAENTVVGNYIARPYPSIGILLLSVGIMLFSGVVAGLLPVYKALEIKAIDAIRDE